MSIRIRVVNNICIALCAAETDALPDDIYLDDAAHWALAAKFAQDWENETVNWKYLPEWDMMKTQKLRDAEEELLRFLAENKC